MQILIRYMCACNANCVCVCVILIITVSNGGANTGKDKEQGGDELSYIGFQGG